MVRVQRADESPIGLSEGGELGGDEGSEFVEARGDGEAETAEERDGLWAIDGVRDAEGPSEGPPRGVGEGCGGPRGGGIGSVCPAEGAGTDVGFEPASTTVGADGDGLVGERDVDLSEVPGGSAGNAQGDRLGDRLIEDACTDAGAEGDGEESAAAVERGPGVGGGGVGVGDDVDRSGRQGGDQLASGDPDELREVDASGERAGGVVEDAGEAEADAAGGAVLC